MRSVVSDTGPLLHLTEADLLDLFRLAGDIHIPPAISTELSRYNLPWSAHPPAWLRVTALIAPHAREAAAWYQSGFLEEGEAAALALARQLEADWFLTDDTAARVLATSLGVETHGSLGMVLWAAAGRHLTRQAAEDALNRLSVSTLWVSALAEAKSALDRLFPADNS